MKDLRKLAYRDVFVIGFGFVFISIFMGPVAVLIGGGLMIVLLLLKLGVELLDAVSGYSDLTTWQKFSPAQRFNILRALDAEGSRWDPIIREALQYSGLWKNGISRYSPAKDQGVFLAAPSWVIYARSRGKDVLRIEMRYGDDTSPFTDWPGWSPWIATGFWVTGSDFRGAFVGLDREGLLRAIRDVWRQHYGVVVTRQDRKE
jgi:hypothetical protein